MRRTTCPILMERADDGCVLYVVSALDRLHYFKWIICLHNSMNNPIIFGLFQHGYVIRLALDDNWFETGSSVWCFPKKHQIHQRSNERATTFDRTDAHWDDQVCVHQTETKTTHTHKKKKQPKRNKSGSLSQSVFHYSLRFFGGIITSTCGPPPLFSTNYFNLLFIIRTHLLIEIPLGHGSQTCTMSIECKCQNTRLSC